MGVLGFGNSVRRFWSLFGQHICVAHNHLRVLFFLCKTLLRLYAFHDLDGSSLSLCVCVCRIATAINLHLPVSQKPKNEQHARELLNRTRTWLTCFNVDRSFGSQYGKPPIISNTDYTANHCAEWWSSSEYNLPSFDIHISCYSNELRLAADFGMKIRSDRNNPTGFNRVRQLLFLFTR